MNLKKHFTMKIMKNKRLPDYVEHSAESTKAKRPVIPAGIAGFQCTGTVLMCLYTFPSRIHATWPPAIPAWVTINSIHGICYVPILAEAC